MIQKVRIIDFNCDPRHNLVKQLGDYKCMVDNANGDATSLSQSSYAEVVYQVSIVYAPKVTVSPTEELVVTAETGSNTLTCTSDGKPAGDFKWSKNGVDIEGATNDSLVLDQVE